MGSLPCPQVPSMQAETQHERFARQGWECAKPGNLFFVLSINGGTLSNASHVNAASSTSTKPSLQYIFLLIE